MKRLMLALLFVLLSSTAFAWPEWVGTATITVATDNTTSDAVTLPVGVTQLAVQIPTIDSGTVKLQVSADGVTYQDLYSEHNGTNPVLWQTAAGTGGITALVRGNVGMFKFVKIVTGSQQAANRAFVLIGK